MERLGTLKGWLLFLFAAGVILLLLPYIGADLLTAPHKGLWYFFIVWGGIIASIAAALYFFDKSTSGGSQDDRDSEQS